MANNTNTQTGQNDHNQREHEEKLRREGGKTAGMNEHNRKEHEEKLRREGIKGAPMKSGSRGK